MENFFRIHTGKCLLVLSLMVCVACQNKESKEDHPLEQVCLGDNAKLVKVTRSQVVKKLNFQGKVAYNPNAVVNYVSLVGGVINNSYITLGDKVEKNQVLAEIKSVELNAIETEIQQTHSFLNVAQRQLVSTQSFYDDGIASEKELISAQSEVANLKSELTRLQTNLELYSASTEKGVFQIKAPVSGFIVNNNISTGMQISAEGEPLFTISNLDDVWVNFNIYTTDIDNVKENMEVDIKTSAYPDKVFKGKIAKISQVIDPVENVLKARVVLKNNDLLLKPGLNVETIVKINKEEKAFKLPDDAVVFHNDTYYSVIAKNDCDMLIKRLNILSKDEKMVYVDEGLEQGDQVLVENALLMFDKISSENN